MVILLNLESWLCFPPEASVKMSLKTGLEEGSCGGGLRQHGLPKVMAGGAALGNSGNVQVAGKRPLSQRQGQDSLRLMAVVVSLLVDCSHGCSKEASMGHSQMRCHSSGQSSPHPWGHGQEPLKLGSVESALLAGLQNPATCMVVSMCNSSM